MHVGDARGEHPMIPGATEGSERLAEAVRARAALDVPWFVHPNDLIGGWCCTTVDRPPSQMTFDSAVVADFMDEATARHIANLHNAWLMRQPSMASASSIQKMQDPYASREGQSGPTLSDQPSTVVPEPLGPETSGRFE